VVRRRIWKPRQVRRGLLRLGFTEDPGRGKGDHVWFYKQVECLSGESHTITTMVDMGVEDIPHRTMFYILDALALDEETFYQAYRGQYTEAAYAEYLLTVPKQRLMPPAMRQ